MRATSRNPSGRGNFEIRLGYPYASCHRQLGKRVLRGDKRYFIDDQPEAVPHVDYGSVNSLTTRRREYQAHWVSFATNGKRMDLGSGPFVGDRGANLQHVSA